MHSDKQLALTMPQISSSYRTRSTSDHVSDVEIAEVSMVVHASPRFTSNTHGSLLDVPTLTVSSESSILAVMTAPTLLAGIENVDRNTAAESREFNATLIIFMLTALLKVCFQLFHAFCFLSEQKNHTQRHFCPFLQTRWPLCLSLVYLRCSRLNFS